MTKLVNALRIPISLLCCVLGLVWVMLIVTKGIIFNPTIWNYVFMLLGFGVIIGGLCLFGSGNKKIKDKEGENNDNKQ